MKQTRITIWKFLFILITTFSINKVSAATLLVGNVLSNSVTLLNETSLQPMKEITVGNMPHEIAVSPNGRTAIVGNFGDVVGVFPGNTLTSINIENATVNRTIELPAKSRPHGLAFLNDSEILVTAQGIQSLLKIDVLTGRLIQQISLPGAGAHMVVVDSTKRFAYVTNTDSGSVVKIDLREVKIIEETKIGREAEGITLSPQEDLLLVTNRKDNFVAVIRTKDLSLLKKIPTDKGPVRVVLFDNGRAAAVTNAVSGTVQVIDMGTLSLNKTFKTIDGISLLPVPINMVVQNDKHFAYITNYLANSITLVDLTNGKVLTAFKAGYMPDGIAISPVNTKAVPDTSTSTQFNIGPLEINKNIDRVWQVVKNVNDYERISHGAISAHIDGEMLPGTTISLEIYKDKLIGKFIPKSIETVTIVDDALKIIAWSRKLPDGNYTQRLQLLEKISEDKTRSLITLTIPGIVGSITDLTLKQTLNDSLTELHNGIKAETELH